MVLEREREYEHAGFQVPSRLRMPPPARDDVFDNLPRHEARQFSGLNELPKFLVGLNRRQRIERRPADRET